MGAVASKAANGIGDVLGKAFTAPFKSLFNVSCEDICASTWDVICFIEHLCVSNLLKLFMILCLCFTILIFLYLLLKLGICKCITKSLCKICWAGSETYCFVFTYIPHILWYKLKNTKRVDRRRRRWHNHFEDIESGCISSSGSDCDSSCYVHRHNHPSWSKRKNRGRNRHKLQSINGSHRNGVRLSKREVSVHLNRSSRRSGRRLQLIKVRRHKKKASKKYLRGRYIR